MSPLYPQYNLLTDNPIVFLLTFFLKVSHHSSLHSFFFLSQEPLLTQLVPYTFFFLQVCWPSPPAWQDGFLISHEHFWAAHLVEFTYVPWRYVRMYPVFTRRPSEIYRWRLRSLLLCPSSVEHYQFHSFLCCFSHGTTWYLCLAQRHHRCHH